MTLAARVDDYGRAGWIAATVLAFIVWWPLGLASLAFVLATKRLNGEGFGRWQAAAEQGAEAMRGGPWGRCGGRGRGQRRGPGPRSGNAAFDEYRAETLRRLEDEQREFVDYLEKLRRARDKAEFDQFMADRRRGPTTPDAPQAS